MCIDQQLSHRIRCLLLAIEQSWHANNQNNQIPVSSIDVWWGWSWDTQDRLWGGLSVKLISVAGPRAWNKSASARAPWADSSRSPLCSGIAHKRATGVRTASAHSLYGYSFISCLHWWGGTRREERLRFDFSAVSPSRSQYGSPETWRESAATRACLTVDGVMTGKPAFPWWQVCLVFVLVCCVSFVLSR